MSGFITNSFQPKATFSTDEIPDLTGQVMIVTGGNTGIGKETARVCLSIAPAVQCLLSYKVLLAHNAKVYLAGRNPQKVQAAIKDLLEQTGKEANELHLDLADLKSIRQSVEDFQKSANSLSPTLFNY